MAAEPRRVLSDALDLSTEQRAELVARLIDSLDEEQDERSRSAWEAEIEERIREIDGGAVNTVPWPEARKAILSPPNGANQD
jgi:putative addiction module component (TIGR02574 family)